MGNINDYILWRGDLSFKEKEFNTIDGMVLARFSYLPFHLIDMKKKETVASIAKKMADFKESDFSYNGDKDLILNMGKSVRFKDLIVTDYVNHFSKEVTKQFSAITIHLNKKEVYVSYNGTDNSLIGWKEDFNMSFMDEVPSQLEGLEYLKHIYDKYKCNLRVGGHSKGGSIAVFAGIYVGKRIKNRIIQITNYDGPGFSKKIVDSKEYKEIVDKVLTIIPQDSIIGRIMNHKEKYLIVQSTEKGIYQHDIYSWQVLGTDIVKAEALTKNSNLINNTITEYLETTSPENRKIFIDLAFQILNSADVNTFKQLEKVWITKLPKMYKTYSSLTEEDKKLMTEMLTIFIKTSIKIRTNKEE